MALNIRRYSKNKKLIENYINDNGVNVAVLIETNLSNEAVKDITLLKFAITFTSSGVERRIIGGGGGGVMILVHESIPCVK